MGSLYFILLSILTLLAGFFFGTRSKNKQDRLEEDRKILQQKLSDEETKHAIDKEMGTLKPDPTDEAKSVVDADPDTAAGRLREWMRPDEGEDDPDSGKG